MTCFLLRNERLDLETNSDKELKDSFHNLLEYAILASQKDPFDPLEKEIKRNGESLLVGQNIFMRLEFNPRISSFQKAFWLFHTSGNLPMKKTT